MLLSAKITWAPFLAAAIAAASPPLAAQQPGCQRSSPAVSGAAQLSAGQAAARGRVDEALLARLMARAWFDRPPPKSLDRQDFADVIAMVSANR